MITTSRKAPLSLVKSHGGSAEFIHQYWKKKFSGASHPEGMGQTKTSHRENIAKKSKKSGGDDPSMQDIKIKPFIKLRKKRAPVFGIFFSQSLRKIVFQTTLGRTPVGADIVIESSKHRFYPCSMLRF